MELYDFLYQLIHMLCSANTNGIKQQELAWIREIWCRRCNRTTYYGFCHLLLYNHFNLRLLMTCDAIPMSFLCHHSSEEITECLSTKNTSFLHYLLSIQWKTSLIIGFKMCHQLGCREYDIDYSILVYLQRWILIVEFFGYFFPCCSTMTERVACSKELGARLALVHYVESTV